MEKVKIEVSARHVHLSENDYSSLFASDEPKKEQHLSQDDWATNKVIKIVGKKGELPARVLIPFRKKSQVELSLSDCITIGVSAPYAISSEETSSKVKIKGDAGEIEVSALIVAKRHLHLSPCDAENLKIENHEQVKVEIETDRGKIIFENVTAKIANHYTLAVHLDTDEGNAAGINKETVGNLTIS